MVKREINSDTINDIAKTAAIRVSDDKQRVMQDNLSKMVDLFVAMDKIKVCETKKSDLCEISNTVLRADVCHNVQEITASQSTYAYYDNDSGNFIVPKVLETEV